MSAAVIGEFASTALGVYLRARERSLRHDAIRRSRRKPDRENVIGHVQRDFWRKPLENLLDDDIRNHASFKKDEVLLPRASVRLFGSISPD